MRLSLFLATSLLTATTAASVSANDGFETYGFVFGGLSAIQDPTFSGTVNGDPEQVETFFESTDISLGFGIGVSLSQWAPGLRGELELSYTNGDINNTNFSGNGPAQEPADGDISTTRLLATLYKDFEIDSAFTPYVGAGLGIASADVGINYGPGFALDDRDNGLAAQIVLGGSYALNDRLDLTGDIRYIRDFDIQTRRFSPTGALTGSVEDDIETVTVNVGLRYKF